jgi:hypothetical protein
MSPRASALPAERARGDARGHYRVGRNSGVRSATRETLAQPMAKQQSREPVLGRVLVVQSGRECGACSDARSFREAAVRAFGRARSFVRRQVPQRA